MELNDYEKKHIKYLEENASECTLFLKRNNEFPITKPTSVLLIGNGSRNTIKGGTGSGDIKSRFIISFEEGLKRKGFNIVSTNWMDKYDEFKKSTKKDYIKSCKSNARKNKTLSFIYSMGFFEEEKNYNISCDYDADIAIYVLARNSGEGNDRRNIKGDILLSDKEVEDILFLNNKFKKFMLVLNVGGVIDLSPILEVSNILLISQLGIATGNILAGIILGEYNPSGKLTTTWTKPLDYPFFNEFGDKNDINYKEGIYLGYRYFSSINKDVYFPFGYGLSYTDFQIDNIEANLNKFNINIKCDVKNIGNYKGKEVVEVYISKPNDYIDNPKYELCGYYKTKALLPLEIDNCNININLLDFVSYDVNRSCYLLLKGEYIISIGNSIASLKPILKIINKNEIITLRVNNKLNNSNIIDYRPNIIKSNYSNIKEVILDITKFNSKEINYKRDTYIDPLINTLSDSELIYTCLGHHTKGIASIVGSSCYHVVGGAGETTLKVSKIKKSLTMADGPAGIRIKQEYGIDEKGIYDISIDPIMEKMLDFIPKIARVFIKPPKNRNGKIYHQYTTALPIGTALAQSFNNEFIKKCGSIIKEEMEYFGIDLWLAPALNIHRNILCGRNFEYYSEDPYLSGMIASYMVKGVENNSNCGTTIKHFAVNNQEFNRTNASSNVSERALREIYLKDFEICIKNSNPKAIMTSYNLINGIHTSESFELINDILRCEWEYKGLVMTDWIQSGRKFTFDSKYASSYASNIILAGNDLIMSGSHKDYRNLMKGLRKGIIKREDLLYCASRVYRAILRQKS